jgi:Leucine-rich repeat (LRR) protein
MKEMNSTEIIIEPSEIPYRVFDNINLQALSITLEEFDMGNRESLKPNFLIRLLHLEKLSLVGIQISPEIFVNEICKLTLLKELTLMYSGLNIIPSEIENLVNLQAIVFRCNSLDSFPESIVNLKKLKSINLIDNQFKEIPINLWKLRKLKSINLRDNPIESKYQNVIDSNGFVKLKEGRSLIGTASSKK